MRYSTAERPRAHPEVREVAVHGEQRVGDHQPPNVGRRSGQQLLWTCVRVRARKVNSGESQAWTALRALSVWAQSDSSTPGNSKRN